MSILAYYAAKIYRDFKMNSLTELLTSNLLCILHIHRALVHVGFSKVSPRVPQLGAKYCRKQCKLCLHHAAQPTNECTTAACAVRPGWARAARQSAVQQVAQPVAALQPLMVQVGFRSRSRRPGDCQLTTVMVKRSEVAGWRVMIWARAEILTSTVTRLGEVQLEKKKCSSLGRLLVPRPCIM